MKITELLLDEYGKKNTYLKQNYYEIGPGATKLLAKRIRKQHALNTIQKIRDPRTNELIHEPEGIENIFKGFYKKLYTQPPAANEEEVRHFLEQLDLPSIGSRQNERLTADITTEEIIQAINSLKNNK